ncbi:hypothetical protein LTR37_001326 [Vermiconidia calcicola]|uniref:Uncharacterized protein n=1 Tax=Vermiconidia calcicola TaxID=1690605 RepID=A0ACC3NWJ7_9PEZI|nr:hypothetical protein LTR37_001326 [Vermiconidia calcicola]
MSLATPGAFNEDPGLVWQFYSYRRHMSLQAKPNPAHYALAALAEKVPGFQTLSQNVDGLSPRAKHPPKQLQLLHGSLFDLKCADRHCGYICEDYTDPIVPALAIPTSGADLTSNEAREQDISDVSVSIPKLKHYELPQCPKCTKALLRPGVVWFGENLPFTVLETVDDYLASREKIDLMLVIGTSAKVHPAAGYIDKARQRGARVAVINTDENDRPPRGWNDGDWFFCGDAAQILPELLKPVIGDLPRP